MTSSFWKPPSRKIRALKTSAIPPTATLSTRKYRPNCSGSNEALKGRAGAGGKRDSHRDHSLGQRQRTGNAHAG